MSKYDILSGYFAHLLTSLRLSTPESPGFSAAFLVVYPADILLNGLLPIARFRRQNLEYSYTYGRKYLL